MPIDPPYMLENQYRTYDPADKHGATPAALTIRRILGQTAFPSDSRIVSTTLEGLVS